MASAAARSKAVVVIYSLFIVAPIVCGALVFGSWFCFVLSISLGKRGLIALLLLCSEYHVAVIVL